MAASGDGPDDDPDAMRGEESTSNAISTVADLEALGGGPADERKVRTMKHLFQNVVYGRLHNKIIAY